MNEKGKNKNAKEKRDYEVRCRVTTEEREKIEELAGKCSMNRAEYVRLRALGFEPRTVQPEIFFRFYQKLCTLCDKISDKVSKKTEDEILDLADDIKIELLLNRKDRQL